jgi:hypothetical protein
MSISQPPENPASLTSTAPAEPLPTTNGSTNSHDTAAQYYTNGMPAQPAGSGNPYFTTPAAALNDYGVPYNPPGGNHGSSYAERAYAAFVPTAAAEATPSIPAHSNESLFTQYTHAGAARSRTVDAMLVERPTASHHPLRRRPGRPSLRPEFNAVNDSDQRDGTSVRRSPGGQQL